MATLEKIIKSEQKRHEREAVRQAALLANSLEAIHSLLSGLDLEALKDQHEELLSVLDTVLSYTLPAKTEAERLREESKAARRLKHLQEEAQPAPAQEPMEWPEFAALVYKKRAELKARVKEYYKNRRGPLVEQDLADSLQALEATSENDCANNLLRLDTAVSDVIFDLATK